MKWYGKLDVVIESNDIVTGQIAHIKNGGNIDLFNPYPWYLSDFVDFFDDYYVFLISSHSGGELSKIERIDALDPNTDDEFINSETATFRFDECVVNFSSNTFSDLFADLLPEAGVEIVGSTIRVFRTGTMQCAADIDENYYTNSTSGYYEEDGLILGGTEWSPIAHRPLQELANKISNYDITELYFLLDGKPIRKVPVNYE